MDAIANQEETLAEETLLLTIPEICEHLHYEQRNAYNFAKQYATGKIRENGESVFEIPASALKAQLQKAEKRGLAKSKKANEEMLQMQERVLELQGELLQSRDHLLQLQAENIKLETNCKMLNNQIAGSNAILQKRQEEQAELESLKAVLRRIPSCIVKFFSVFGS